jgi:hypothetical protein
LLSACASTSPYEAGKTSADVAAHVDVINLKKVYLYGGEADDPQAKSGPHQKPDPLEETDPSTNDQEVLAVAKTNIVSQLTNLGYSIVDGDKADADIRMSFAVSYIPERVLFVHRAVGVLGLVYAPDGHLLFRLGAGKASAGGAFGSMVQSRDELVSACAREAVVNVVTEMRKGTLENSPVAKKKQAMVQKQEIAQ